jgi:hypothetical protein
VLYQCLFSGLDLFVGIGAPQNFIQFDLFLVHVIQVEGNEFIECIHETSADVFTIQVRRSNSQDLRVPYPIHDLLHALF